MLLRLTGKARSAADDGVALEADVTGCTLTGAAYGDLSSEKVYVRLRTMTCSGPGPGTVIETRVSGFVAGGGKAGVRGPVVSREGALVEKAFLAGLVSGAGETAAGMLRVPAGDGEAGRAADLGDLGRAGSGRRRGLCGPQSGGLPDQARRAVPAGDPVADGHAGHGGVHRGRAHRRTGRRENQKTEERQMKITKLHMRALAPLLLAALLTGCAGSAHVGESWQCPLAQGTACASVSEADPAVAATSEARETTSTTPLRPTETTGTSFLSDILTWFAELFSPSEDDEEVATAEPLIIPGAAKETPAEPNENLRTKERVARIWIAPYVDTGGVYREGHWVRVVVTPARWRLP